MYTIDSTSADVTPVGGLLIDGPIAFGAGGTLFMAQMNCSDAGHPSALYTVDTASGNATYVAGLDRYYIALGMGPDGMLYGADFAGNEQWGNCGGTWGDIYRIDPSNGDETFLGSNEGHVIHDIAFSDQSNAPVPALAGWGLGALAGVIAVLGAAVLVGRRLLGQ